MAEKLLAIIDDREADTIVNVLRRRMLYSEIVVEPMNSHTMGSRFQREQQCQ